MCTAVQWHCAHSMHRTIEDRKEKHREVKRHKPKDEIKIREIGRHKDLAVEGFWTDGRTQTGRWMRMDEDALTEWKSRQAVTAQHVCVAVMSTDERSASTTETPQHAWPELTSCKHTEQTREERMQQVESVK